MPMKSKLPTDTILIVEDDVFISMDAADSVSRAGVNVVTAETVYDALDILEHEDISAAILDFHVRDGAVTPIVAVLRARKAFPSGSSPDRPSPRLPPMASRRGSARRSRRIISRFWCH